jgi:hypothetical protein
MQIENESRHRKTLEKRNWEKQMAVVDADLEIRNDA